MKSAIRAMMVASCLISLVMLSGCGAGTSQQSVQRPTITTVSVPNGVIDVPYLEEIRARGGVAPFTWTVSAGALPHNLILGGSTTNTVTISGTPDTVMQGAAFSIAVMDSANQSVSQPYTLSILLGPDPATLSPGIMGFSCTASLLFTGCTPPETATLTNTGAATLNVLGISISGSYFSQTNNCPSTLEAGQSCAITVSFDGPASRTHPKKETFNGSVLVYDGATQNPLEVSLTGTTSGVP
jgi:hypothetical protein